MFDMVLELVAGLGRHLFKLFQHPSLAIVKAAGLIMKSIIEVRLINMGVAIIMGVVISFIGGDRRDSPQDARISNG